MSKPSQILVYTRPWEVRFHLELIQQFKMEFPGLPVRFLTFFDWARKRVVEAGEEVVYLPERLRQCTEGPEHDARLRVIDAELHANFAAGLNLLAQSERFLPADRVAATDFIRRHAIVLDDLVAPLTLSVSGMYDHFVYWLGGLLANARGGWHFAFVGSAVPRRTVLALRTPWEPWCSTGNYAAGPSLETARHQIIEPSIQIEYMQAEPPRALRQRLKGRLEWRLADRHDLKAGSYFSSFSWPRLLFSDSLIDARRKPRRPKYDIFSEEDLAAWGPGTGRDFFYVPLHMEPEATILMYSPWLRDQKEMCRLLSQALPTGCALLVKENPKMDRRRPLDYYQSLSRLPGVYLVAPEVSSLSLLNRARGVIALAGSACLEAALLGKPSLVLARPPFRFFLPRTDFAGEQGLPLSQLGAWMRAPRILDPDSLQQCWNKWLGATFKGSNVPRYFGGPIPELNPSTDNVTRYYQYIMSVLSRN